MPRDPNNMIFRALTHFGYLGVDLFFVLSGFLILGQTFNKLKQNKFKVSDFYKRRFMRTLPNYYLILLIAGLMDQWEGFNWRYLLFLQNFGEFTWHTITWSLCVEEHFYLLVPLLIFYFSKKNRMHQFPHFVLYILTFGLVLRAVIFNHYRPDLLHATNADLGNKTLLEQLFYPTYVRLDGLALGGFLAYLMVYKEALWNKLLDKGHWIGLASLISLGPTLFFAHHKVSFANAVPGKLIFALIFSGFTIWSVSPKSGMDKWKSSLVTLTSVLSYSMYLTHLFAIALALSISKALGISEYGVISYTLMIVCIYLFSLSLYFFWEKPILSLRK